MKVLNKQAIAFLTTFVLFSFAASSAHAVPTLRLTQGATTVTTADGSAGDLDPTIGSVVHIGSVGAFNVNITTGISKPLLGTAAAPHLDLNSINLSSGSGGTLTILFSDTGFNTGTNLTNFLTQIGGTTGGTVAWSVFASATNNVFATDTLIASGVGGPGAFSTTSFDPFTPSGPYSLTLQAVINHTGPDNSSFNFETEVPEPAPLALISLGLFILGGFQLKTLRYLV